MVKERQSATFECELSFDDATVTWYKDSWELRESPKYTFRREGRRHFMIIRNVTAEDEGVEAHKELVFKYMLITGCIENKS